MTWAEKRTTDGGTLEMRADYSYDVFGNRIEKEIDDDGDTNVDLTERYSYDGWKPGSGFVGTENWDIWADLDDTSSLTTRYLRGNAIDQLFSRIDSGGTAAHYFSDHLGSVRHMTDGSGTLQNTIAYDGFGNITSESSPSFGDRYTYASRERDVETAFYYNRARYYNPEVGRWTSEDPLGFGAGDSNLFRYVTNNPTNINDPSGLQRRDPPPPGAPIGGFAVPPKEGPIAVDAPSIREHQMNMRILRIEDDLRDLEQRVERRRLERRLAELQAIQSGPPQRDPPPPGAPIGGFAVPPKEGPIAVDAPSIREHQMNMRILRIEDDLRDLEIALIQKRLGMRTIPIGRWAQDIVDGFVELGDEVINIGWDTLQAGFSLASIFAWDVGLNKQLNPNYLWIPPGVQKHVDQSHNARLAKPGSKVHVPSPWSSHTFNGADLANQTDTQGAFFINGVLLGIPGMYLTVEGAVRTGNWQPVRKMAGGLMWLPILNRISRMYRRRSPCFAAGTVVHLASPCPLVATANVELSENSWCLPQRNLDIALSVLFAGLVLGVGIRRLRNRRHLQPSNDKFVNKYRRFRPCV